ncbi:MAG TPA: hypothetical protein VGO39_06645 [Gaiellaceae bacterium]|nr:hypothetical protein [Gaiellaceae bacterium]
MPLLAPTELPWRAPRHELLLLALVAVAALTVVYPVGAQDVSRLCLTRAAAQGRLAADACLAGAVDVADYGGHRYSDKAPGVSFLALPVAEAVGLGDPAQWHQAGDLRVWAARATVGGLALLLCAFLVGRVAEGLVPGTGGPTLVAFALGTEAAALTLADFGHVPAAALAFAAFLLAWRRRPFLAGLVAGASVLVEYEAGLIAVVLAGYVLLTGARALGRYLVGVAPAALVLGAYDWAAFGSPFHLSYRYVADEFAANQAAGFFGIHAPSWHAIRLVFVGDRGLLFDSPFLLAAAAGLVLLWRSRAAEAAVCTIVVLAFLALDCGYYDPYGGDSPGPRFLVPALPFLALGLPLVLARFRILGAALVTASLVASTAIALTWPAAANASERYHGTVWRRLAGLLRHGAAEPLASWAQKNLLSWVGIGRLGAAAVVLCATLAALVLAFRRADASSPHPSVAGNPPA